MRSTSPATRHLSLASLLFLCVAGLLIAINLQGPTEYAVCQSSGCQAVLDSRYSHIGPWPVAWLGTAFYAAMIFLWGALTTSAPNRFRATVLPIALFLSTGAIAVSLFLTGLQFLVLHAICPLCLTSAVICVAICAITFYLFEHPDWQAQPLAAIASVALLGAIAFLWLPARPHIVARIGAQIITRPEMENALGSDARKARWQSYRLEKNWLDQKLTDLLVQREAAVRHISPGELVQRAVDDPTNQQVEEFMKTNSANLKPEDLPIVRYQMRARFKVDRAEAFVAQLMRKYDASEYLPPPSIDERDLNTLPGPHRGGSALTAPIRLVIFSDFGCEYCAHTARAITAVMQRYGNKISLVFHYLPLDIHPRGRDAAIAAECAAEQGQFGAYHDALMSHDGQLGGLDFVALAGALKINETRFRECLADSAAARIVAQSRQRANQLGIDSTPALFLNGQRIGGDVGEPELLDWIARTEGNGVLPTFSK